MKITDIVEKYTIYCDMDGVLVDFEKGASALMGHGFTFKEFDSNPSAKKELWSAVNRKTKNNEPFWENLEPMSDYRLLWDFIKGYNPTILTATGIRYIDEVDRQKKNWCKKHLGNVPVITVKTANDKQKYADKHSILIDDRHKALDPWIEAGGIGILHTSAASTIEKLKELL